MAKQLVFSGVLLLASLILYTQSRQMEYPTFLYINTLLALLALTAVLNALHAVLKRPLSGKGLSATGRRKTLLAAAAAIGYAVLLPVIGFYSTSFLYFTGMVQGFTPKRTGKGLAVTLLSGLAGTFLLYGLFDLLLNVPTPKGFLL